MKSNSTILVVEDQVSEREAILRFLRSERYQAFGASTAVDAFERHPDVDLVLSDVLMGSKSGLDLLKMWKGRNPTTPFLLMTAFAHIEDAVDAVKAGAQDYLVKPVNPQVLLEKIEAALASPPWDAAAPMADHPLMEIQRSAIEQTLDACGGNRTHCAQMLGISVRTLQRKLKAWHATAAVESLEDVPAGGQPASFAAWD
jgi:DNA-binding NtrC family response regulator